MTLTADPKQWRATGRNCYMPRRPDSAGGRRTSGEEMLLGHRATHMRSRTPPPRPRQPRTAEELRRRSIAIMGYGGDKVTREERREMCDLMYEHWNDLKRAKRSLDLCADGLVPVAAFCTAACQELAIRRERDSRVLASVVLENLLDDSGSLLPHPLAAVGEALVDFKKLWETVQRRPPKKGWQNRFRAAGVMPVALQRHTTGVEYALEHTPRHSSLPCVPHTTMRHGTPHPHSVSTRTRFEGPPYAVCGDSDHMKTIIKEYFRDRCERMQEVLLQHCAPGRPGYLTPAEFKKAMLVMERYGANDKEVEALVNVMERRTTGLISVDDFLDRFSLEYLKGRSMRLSVGRCNNDGNSNTLQWPASLQPEFKKKELMEALRTRQFTTRKVSGSRSSSLRTRQGRSARKAYDCHPYFPSKSGSAGGSGSVRRPASATPEATFVYTRKGEGGGGAPRHPVENPTKAELTAGPIEWEYVRPDAATLGNIPDGPASAEAARHFVPRPPTPAGSAGSGSSAPPVRRPVRRAATPIPHTVAMPA